MARTPARSKKKAKKKRAIIHRRPIEQAVREGNASLAALRRRDLDRLSSEQQAFRDELRGLRLRLAALEPACKESLAKSEECDRESREERRKLQELKESRHRGLLGMLFTGQQFDARGRREVASQDAIAQNAAQRARAAGDAHHSNRAKQAELYRRQLFLEAVLPRYDRVITEKANSAKREKRDRDRIDNLLVVAAANSEQAREVAARVKARLASQISCPYCGHALGREPHADHIYPVSRGGKSVPSNMVFVCKKCNIQKSDMTLLAFIRRYKLDRDVIEARLLDMGKEF